jgi:murein DD-endopeptidase MepM/ murein hydrolase activator NlpD
MSKWKFPIPLKKLGSTSDSMSFKNIDITKEVEVPTDNHVGAFCVKRKYDIHRGVDLYCPVGTNVYAVEDGEIVDIRYWTGEFAQTPWWNDTWAVLVEGESGCVAYSELVPEDNLKIGMKVKQQDLIGVIIAVLKKDKGRPISMLHLQIYKHGLTRGGYKTNMTEEDIEKTSIDPTPFLLEAEPCIYKA